MRFVVTAEKVAHYEKLATDLDSAFAQGGESGIQFLTGLIPEWRDSIDEINAGYRTCWDLIHEGLRHEALGVRNPANGSIEALGWHAEGFFEAADRLDPDRRPSWTDMRARLLEREIELPGTVDSVIRASVEAAFHEVDLRNLQGQSINELLDALRCNAVGRGPLGERLITLQNLRDIDGSKAIWLEMMHDIGRIRSGEIAEETRAAITAKDVDKLVRLYMEASRSDWGAALGFDVRTSLEAGMAWNELRSLQSRLESEARMLCRLHERAAGHDLDPSSRQAAVDQLLAQREAFRSLEKTYQHRLETACASPEVARCIEETSLVHTCQAVGSVVEEVHGWLDGQERIRKTQERVERQEREIARVMSRCPSVFRKGDSDAWTDAAEKWLMTASACEDRAARLCGSAAGRDAESLQESLARLRMKYAEIESEIRRSVAQRNRIIIGIGLALGAAVIVLVVLVILGAERTR